jgi:hypothetical protein
MNINRRALAIANHFPFATGYSSGGSERASILATASPETLAYILAVEAEDGEELENEVLIPIVEFANWRIPFGGACSILSAARTINGALVPMVGPAPTAVNFVSADYNRLNGLTGANVSGKVIMTGYTISLAQQNDHHAVFHCSVLPINVFRTLMGNGMATAVGVTVMSHLNPVSTCRVHSSLNAGSVGVLNFLLNPGFKGLARNSSAAYFHSNGTTEVSVTRVTGVPLAQEMYLFDIPGGAISSSGSITMYSVGSFIDLTEFRLRTNAFRSALEAAGL